MSEQKMKEKGFLTWSYGESEFMKNIWVLKLNFARFCNKREVRLKMMKSLNGGLTCVKQTQRQAQDNAIQ